MTDMITQQQEKQIVRLTEDAANKAAKEVLAGLPLDKDTAQKVVIEKGDELQAVLVPVISASLSEFIAKKVNILIKVGDSNPYFDQQFDYWVELWKKLGIKDPNFNGIKPFIEHAGYRPLILPKHELVTSQYLYDRCRERFNCWKFCNGSLDKVVIKNDRDPRAGAYVAWFRDRVEADEELKNLSAAELKENDIPGITLLERELMEYDQFDRTSGHIDINNATLCSGSRYDGGDVPRVGWSGGELLVDWDAPRSASDRLRSRQQFPF